MDRLNEHALVLELVPLRLHVVAVVDVIVDLPSLTVPASFLSVELLRGVHLEYRRQRLL